MIMRNGLIMYLPKQNTLPGKVYPTVMKNGYEDCIYSVSSYVMHAVGWIRLQAGLSALNSTGYCLASLDQIVRLWRRFSHFTQVRMLLQHFDLQSLLA